MNWPYVLPLSRLPVFGCQVSNAQARSDKTLQQALISDISAQRETLKGMRAKLQDSLDTDKAHWLELG